MLIYQANTTKRAKKKYNFAEDREAETFMLLLQYRMPSIADLIFHIPNGGSRNVLEATRFKKQGVKAGIPDYFLPVATNKYHGLFIELKSKTGTLQASQKIAISKLLDQGYHVAVAKGADQAYQIVSEYIKDA